MMDNNGELKNQILQDFKTLNGIEENSNDAIYTLYIDKSVQAILNLTNRVYLPVELKYIVLDMINDFYTIKEKNQADDTYIKSLSEAGRSVSLESTSQVILNSLLSNHITLELNNRQKQIYRYRLLYRETLRKEDVVEEN